MRIFASGEAMRGALNNSNNDGNEFVFEDLSQRIAIGIIAVIITLLGTIGNTLVILSCALSRELRPSFGGAPTRRIPWVLNLFVVQLACADLLTCLLIPVQLVGLLNLSGGWPGPSWVCAVAAGLLFLCLGVSVLTLAFIAYASWLYSTRLDGRYDRVYSLRNTGLMLAFTWVYPLLLILIPHFAGLGRLGYSKKYKVCFQDSSVSTAEFYSFLSAAFVGLPVFCVVVYSYTRIFLYVRKQNRPERPVRYPDVPNKKISAASGSTGPTKLRHGGPLTGSETVVNTQTPGATSNNPEVIPMGDSSLGDPSKRASPSGPDTVLPQPQSRRRSAKQLDAKLVRAVKSMALVTVTLFLCLTPFGICVIAPIGFANPGVPWTGLVVSVRCVINPLVYAWKLDTFGLVMGSILCCKLRKIPSPTGCIRRGM